MIGIRILTQLGPFHSHMGLKDPKLFLRGGVGMYKRTRNLGDYFKRPLGLFVKLCFAIKICMLPICFHIVKLTSIVIFSTCQYHWWSGSDRKTICQPGYTNSKKNLIVGLLSIPLSTGVGTRHSRRILPQVRMEPATT